MTEIKGLDKFDTHNVTTMAGMFHSCQCLTDIDVTSFNTQAVTNMYQMFRDTGIKSIDLSKFDTGNVKNIDYMFYGCSALESVTFGEKCQMTRVNDMDWMFANCTSLKSIDVSMFGDCNNINSLRDMFINCTSLTEFDATGFNVRVHAYGLRNMFNGCTSIKRIDLKSFYNNTLADFKGIVSGCTNLEYLDISNIDITKYTDMDYVTGNDGRKNMFLNAGAETENGCEIRVNEVSYTAIIENSKNVAYNSEYQYLMTADGEAWDEVIKDSETEVAE